MILKQRLIYVAAVCAVMVFGSVAFGQSTGADDQFGARQFAYRTAAAESGPASAASMRAVVRNFTGDDLQVTFTADERQETAVETEPSVESDLSVRRPMYFTERTADPASRTEQPEPSGPLMLPKEPYPQAQLAIPKRDREMLSSLGCEYRFTGCLKIEKDDNGKRRDGKFHWKPAIYQSLIMMGIQHGYAIIFQEKTRRAIKDGPFIQDYFDSVKAIHGWDDGNRFFTNYIAHPMQGSLTGFIFLQNHDKYRDRDFANTKDYWKGTLKAFLWSTVWSTQWEIGPISQSSLGNVGLYGHMGMVDMVITPTVGTGLMVTEEALDTFLIKRYENKSFTAKLLLRMFLNPTRTLGNLLRFKEPWYRDRH